MKVFASHRRGSALLVVLGMLAFMVISGLAFSVFMRGTRMPSSFTRRTVMTRQLARAALAEAISQIDCSVANDPHPNVRRGSNEFNYWLGRVLISADETEGSKMPHEVVNEIESGWDNLESGGCQYTVPILTLEALAYLPAPLVNEARYYGQRTPTAAWQTFDFSAGRYAFIALDVSDYFDVNRLLADWPRSSNPARRVTFSYAFDKADHSDWEGGADDWDDFMKSFRDVGTDGILSFESKVPLVSLADFSLAFWDKFQDSGLAGMKSVFGRYLGSGGDGNGFYGVTSLGKNSEIWKYAQMTFVTDSLDVPQLGTTDIDLDKESVQSDLQNDLAKGQETRKLDAVRDYKDNIFRGVATVLPDIGMCALSDYLDPDRIPISLGMPSVERVPMICGLKPTVAEDGVVSVKVLTKMDEDKVVVPEAIRGDVLERTVKRTIHWRLDPVTFAKLLQGNPGVDALVVYPFRNHEQANEKNFFEMDGKMQFFLSTVPMPLRTGNQDDLLHFGADDDEHVKKGDVSKLCTKAKLVQQAVFEFPLNYENSELATIPYDGLEKPKDCMKKVELVLDRGSTATINDALKDEQGDLLHVTYQWKQTKNLDKDGNPTGEWDPLFKDEIPTFEKGAKILLSGDDRPAASIMPLGANGAIDTSFLSKIEETKVEDISFHLNMAVAVRVKNSSSAGEDVLGTSSGTKTLDMVPATAYDDENLNGVRNTGSRMQNCGGLSTPLMKFVGVECTINPQTTSSGSKFDVQPSKGVMVDDPRWNHAPENWKVLANFSEDGWLEAQTSGAADRDGDIFMASSDQGYLQSVYELAFLPSLPLEYEASDYDGASRTELGAGVQTDAGWMWKTYDILGRYGDDVFGGEDFEDLGFVNNGSGLRVNPYSDMTNVIMAAFANTPHDWRVASDPELGENPAENELKHAESFNKNHAWNEYSDGARLSWLALSAVAGDFMSRTLTKARGGGDWQDAFFDLFDRDRAADSADYLCGVNLQEDRFKPASGANDAIYSVDKKFLYGYWRNCFAARQQLFLVFFRTEPMLLGGGIAGVTPPQLGARGMAVVWRNPDKTGDEIGYSAPGVVYESYKPHQTRVLFYRQFE